MEVSERLRIVSHIRAAFRLRDVGRKSPSAISQIPDASW